MLYMFNDDRIFDYEIRQESIARVIVVATLISSMVPLVNEIKEPAFIPISLMILSLVAILCHVCAMTYAELPPTKQKTITTNAPRIRRRQKTQKKIAASKRM